MSPSSAKPDFSEVISAVVERLGKNERLRRNLPGGGRLRIDRQLPFLCIYRRPPATAPADRGTRELVTSEAAYLFAEASLEQHEALVELCRRVGQTMQEHFGMFLFLEIWADNDTANVAEAEWPRPAFQLHAADAGSVPSTLEAFAEGLRAIRFRGRPAAVEVVASGTVSAPELPPLELACPETGGGCVHLGIAVRPIYRERTGGEFYPLVLQRLRRRLAMALRQGIFAFTGQQSGRLASHYHTLGPSTLVKATRLVDQQLSEVAQSFDFLLQVTPVNADECWKEFAESGYRRQPVFHYRPLAYRPSMLKRRLFEIPIERVEDVTLSHLFWQKQEELDRQLTALNDIGRINFLYASYQLFGEADAELVALAEELLQRIPATPLRSPSQYAHAEEVAAAAREHFDYYHQRLPDFNSRIEICDHIASGMMVSKDCLLISESAGLRRDRLEALLHHEVGTHLLTYFNGRQQPLRQLYAGLAGYEDLQEGLAVLSEHLVGGLTAGRLRALAGRVLAVRSMSDGASFSETFALLHHDRGFPEQSAFATVLRAYRGGGLTKDVIYLRGLRDLLTYLGQGHGLEPLYVGKIALRHVPFVQELRRRGIVQPPALMPRYWDDPQAQARLSACRNRSVTTLLESDS